MSRETDLDLDLDKILAEYRARNNRRSGENAQVSQSPAPQRTVTPPPAQQPKDPAQLATERRARHAALDPVIQTEERQEPDKAHSALRKENMAPAPSRTDTAAVQHERLAKQLAAEPQKPKPEPEAVKAKIEADARKAGLAPETAERQKEADGRRAGLGTARRAKLSAETAEKKEPEKRRAGLSEARKTMLASEAPKEKPAAGARRTKPASDALKAKPAPKVKRENPFPELEDMNSLPEPLDPEDDPAEEPADPRPGPGQGFAMMFVVLMLLAAVLAGLLLWTARDEKARAPQEPEPIRMEIGAELEQYLNESASSSR